MENLRFLYKGQTLAAKELGQLKTIFFPFTRGPTPLRHSDMNHMDLHPVLKVNLFIGLEDTLHFAHNPLCIQFMVRHEGKGNRVVERSTLKNKTYKIIISNTRRHFVYLGIKDVAKNLQTFLEAILTECIMVVRAA